MKNSDGRVVCQNNTVYPIDKRKKKYRFVSVDLATNSKKPFSDYKPQGHHRNTIGYTHEHIYTISIFTL